MTERENFDKAMKKILSVSKAELQRRLEEEKQGKIKQKCLSLIRDQGTRN